MNGLQRFSVVPLLVLFALIASHMSAGNQGDPRVPFETIVQGTHAARRDAGQEVIRSQDEYERVWRRIQNDESNSGTPPEVDFTSKTVIALFMGRRNTGGYSIEVDEVRAGARRVTVYYREYSPDPGDIVTQVLTSPFHLVRIPRLERDIRFSRRN